MIGTGRGLGIALVAAALTVTALVPPAAAIHTQDEYNVHEEYTLSGTVEDRIFFDMEEVPVVCYIRSMIAGVAGTWSAEMYDARNEPWAGEVGAWTGLTRPPTDVLVPIPLFLAHPGEVGPWTLHVQGTGYSPELHIFVTGVDTVDDCAHPPEP